MSIDRRFLNWGVFFIALGAVPLLVDQGAISRSVAGDAWRLWPLVIVGIGVGLLLSRTPAALAGGLIVAATFGLVFGGLLTVGPTLDAVGCGVASSHSGATVTGHATGNLSGSAVARVQFDCGSLTVDTAPGSGWSAEATDPQGAQAEIVNDPGTLEIRGAANGSGWFTSGRWDRTWHVTLPTDPTLDLTILVNAGSGDIDLSNTHLSRLDAEFNAADGRLDLTGATVGDLDVKVNAASGRIVLPSSSSSGSISVNAGSADICTSGDVAMRFRVNGALSSSNFSGANLVQSGNTWTSPDFDTASNRLDLSIDANLGSVTLNPGGGCR